jgi:hypothetical protein
MLKLFHLFSMRLDPVQRRKVVIHQPHHVRDQSQHEHRDRG